MTDFRAPDQLGEPSNRPQRLIFEHASKEASEQIKGKQTNEQARTRAIDQTGGRSAGYPKKLAITVAPQQSLREPQSVKW